MQKTGDIVWISGGCVHWVEAKGWCNNVAWNVGPMSAEQYKLNLLSTEFNRIRKFESLIPMQYLSWKIAKNCKIEDAEMRRLLRGVLIRSLAHNQLTLQYIKSELSVTIYPIEDQLDIETTNCYKCKVRTIIKSRPYNIPNFLDRNL
jgi:histone demethylase